MSSSTFPMFDYDCNIYQPENVFRGHDDDFSTESAVFSIDFFSENTVLMYKKLDVLQKHLLRERISWSTMSRHLSELNVPYYAHPGIIHKITEYAREAVNEDHNIDCEFIPLVVIIKPTVNTNNIINEDQVAISRSMEGEVLNWVPAAASELSMEALEKVKVEGRWKHRCVICLEEMLVGSEAVRMPCLHIYHQDCIVNWLNQSNLCPLCRFQMPV
ncbi:E3 ubiquitin-protein ligase [Melia azedarach]|uniref:E3 ubiquitin-protein ligase n=1 Tax=Melia azedarach TaxID=155640 RepID=A0ACC1XL36_MELAZ|nr:E3 ubiquitin-protein ligase [Melia azedarach]